MSLSACGKPKNNYQTELPEDSRMFQEFVQDRITGRYFHLKNEGNINIYSKIFEKGDNEVTYVQFTDEQLKEYYAPLFGASDKSMTFYNLEINRESLFQTVDDLGKYYLPEITFDNDNIYEIKTPESEKTLHIMDLLKDFKVKEEDKKSINVVAVNEHSFQLNLDVNPAEERRRFAIFMTQDLEDVLIFEGDGEDYIYHYQNGDLDPYEDLFTPLDDDGRFLKIARAITIDTITQDEIVIDEMDDYFRGLVYIGGGIDPLEEGEQCLQKLEDYVAGNDECFRTFDLNYKEMAKALDLGPLVDSAFPVYSIYHSEDLIVLSLKFRAPITGSAGNINVFVDFRKDPENPTIHLVDRLTMF